MRVHLAGTETGHFLHTVALTGHKYNLLSYYHLKRTSDGDQKKLVEAMNAAQMFPIIDSGLFTMMFGAGKGKRYDLAAMTEYTKKYIEDIRALGFNNAVIVECDVHKIVGMDGVVELRKHFKDSGIQTMFVWHREEGMDGLLKLASEESYIALSVPELRILFAEKKTRYQTAVFNLLGRLKRELGGSSNLPKIHLLGNTVKETMETSLAYSCDSTSYLSVVRYGVAIVFDNGKLRQMHVRSPAFLELLRDTMERNPEVDASINTLTETESFRFYMKKCFIAAQAYYFYQRWLDQRFTWDGRK